MNLYSLKPHPYSTIFKPIFGKDWENLIVSIKRHKGIVQPVVVYQNMILDGNQRIRACRELRIYEPKWIPFTGTDEEALELVVGLNLGRRHQDSKSQKATYIALAALEFTRGRPEKLRTGAQLTGKLAEKAGVSLRTVVDAKKVLREGTTEEIEALKSGEVAAKPLAEKIRQREKQSDNGVVDTTGFPVPAEAMPYWNRKAEVQEILSHISAARTKIGKIVDGDPLYRRVSSVKAIHGQLDECYNKLKGALPAYVCPKCDGVKIDDCKQCVGTGVISEFVWRNVVPELRKMREIKGTLNGRISSS